MAEDRERQHEQARDAEDEHCPLPAPELPAGRDHHRDDGQQTLPPWPARSYIADTDGAEGAMNLTGVLENAFSGNRSRVPSAWLALGHRNSDAGGRFEARPPVFRNDRLDHVVD